MDKQRCYSCGFVGGAASFLSYQGTGDHCWTEFRCPQCTRVNPPVAPASTYPGDPTPPFKQPNWWIRERNNGLYVGITYGDGSEFSAPMREDHQLAGAPASILRADLVGTVLDYHKALIRRGKRRSQAFKETCEKIRAGAKDQDEVTQRINLAREENCLGSHDNSERWNGPALEKKAKRR